jgi:hypothetical protein
MPEGVHVKLTSHANADIVTDLSKWISATTTLENISPAMDRPGCFTAGTMYPGGYAAEPRQAS